MCYPFGSNIFNINQALVFRVINLLPEKEKAKHISDFGNSHYASAWGNFQETKLYCLLQNSILPPKFYEREKWKRISFLMISIIFILFNINYMLVYRLCLLFQGLSAKHFLLNTDYPPYKVSLDTVHPASFCSIHAVFSTQPRPQAIPVLSYLTTAVFTGPTRAGLPFSLIGHVLGIAFNRW